MQRAAAAIAYVYATLNCCLHSDGWHVPNGAPDGVTSSAHWLSVVCCVVTRPPVSPPASLIIRRVRDRSALQSAADRALRVRQATMRDARCPDLPSKRRVGRHAGQADNRANVQRPQASLRSHRPPAAHSRTRSSGSGTVRRAGRGARRPTPRPLQVPRILRMSGPRGFLHLRLVLPRHWRLTRARAVRPAGSGRESSRELASAAPAAAGR